MGGPGGPGNPLAFGKSKAKFQMEPNTGITFDDVAGVDEAKQDFMECVRQLLAHRHSHQDQQAFGLAAGAAWPCAAVWIQEPTCTPSPAGLWSF